MVDDYASFGFDDTWIVGAVAEIAASVAPDADPADPGARRACVYHILLDLILYCRNRGVDFEEELRDARTDMRDLYGIPYPWAKYREAR